MRTRTADCGQEKLQTFTCGLAQIFDSSPQFLHRVAVRSPRIIRRYSIPYRHVYALIWAWSPQIPVRSLSCPVRTFNRSMYETVRILSLSPRKICQKFWASPQSAGGSPQFLQSAVRGPRPYFILARDEQLFMLRGKIFEVTCARN
ncbi:hypothetical protein OUZ56_029612 [Daphnia magna]|uniref:Uncharacterized protein n=1 Tax=Daphnia magna TaxID=35525 RepID=A0ABR0B7C3_9CRUS|nr:hypothetical protein OUZ56_029612 [Daphnia magna]